MPSLHPRAVKSVRVTPAESKFLHVLCTRWPRGAAAGTLMVNATEIGRQLSLSADESKAIADSLHQQGLSHARSIEGVVLSIRPRRA